MNDQKFDKHLLAIKYWPAWLAVAFLAIIAFLPWRLKIWLGSLLGKLAWHLIPQRRNDTLINLKLCFPELSDADRDLMARKVFRSGGISLFETATGWFYSPESLKNRIRVEGLEHIKNAEAEGKGVLLLGAHYTQLDLAGTLCANFITVDTVYRPQNNPVLEWFIRSRRTHVYGKQIDHRDMRSLFRSLKDGHIVWYTPDQDFGIKQGVFAPFFGIPAATVTSTSRLARVNNSKVLFIHFCRAADDYHYDILFTPVLENYPSGDDVADATMVNLRLESLIRRAPTQYMWFHRRFKTRPAGTDNVYGKKRNHAKKQRRRAKRAATRAAEKLK